MTQIRPATPDDADDLARIHVQAWEETYANILPSQEIAARTLMIRLRQWQGALARTDCRIAFLPGQGFAQAGPQREAALKTEYPQELYAIYLLDAAKGRGHGRALLRAVSRPGPMSALVLAGNDRATGFYTHTGAQIIETRDDHVGQPPVTEHLVAWPDASFI